MMNVASRTLPLQSLFPSDSVPHAAALPWLGSTISFSRRPLSFLRRTHDRLRSDIVRFTYLGKQVYSLRGKEGTELLFSNENLDLPGGFVEIFGGLLPAQFLPERDEGLYDFSRRRSVFSMSAYLDLVRRSTDEVFTEMGKQGVMDAFALSADLAFRTSSRFLIGEEIMSPGFFARWRELFYKTEPLKNLGRFQLGLCNPLFWVQQQRCFEQINELFSKLIDSRQPRPSGAEESFLDVGLNGIYKERRNETVVGHLYMMFLAGYLNPSLTLGWVLCDLLRADNPYRDRVLHEYYAARKRYPGPTPDRALYDELPLLQMCILETLRMKVSAVNIRKNLHQPIPFQGHQIPVGAIVCNVPTWAHYSEENYDRPTEYNPERWADTEELLKMSMTARYMPFGTMSHICPAKRFSHTWIKMVLGDFFDRFSATLLDKVPAVREGIMPVLGDHDGPCRLRYTLRPA